ncbi:MAG: hypothetical protein WA843_00400 [Candidatus Saccharimonadales bacterium]
MSKQKILIILAVLFTIVNLVPLPRGPLLQCSQGNGGKFPQQFGFPFVYLQRSVSSSACIVSNGESIPYLDHHQAYLEKAILNIAIAGGILIGVDFWLTKRESGQ